MSTDAIVMLKDDHQEIRRLFRAFQEAGDGAAQTRAGLVDKIVEALTVHSYIENEGMYPEIRARVPELEPEILQALEEHHLADVLCGELAGMSPDDEHFTAKATVLIDAVSRHMDEEENDWFPRVRAALGRKDLQSIGTGLIALRDRAPRSPHRSLLQRAAGAISG